MGRRLGSIVVLWLASHVTACDDVRTSASLRLHGDGGSGVTARWTYEDDDVELDLSLTSVRSDAGCSTHASLDVEQAFEDPERHELAPTPCEELELDPSGDLLLDGVATGHDWSLERLEVDVDAKRMALGPWIAPTGERHRFLLESPRCDARRFCECPSVTHVHGVETTVMALGNTCDTP